MSIDCTRNTRPRVGYIGRIAVITIGFLTLPCVGSASVQYTVTDLGTLGGSSSDASAINDSGVVVGSSALAGNSTSDAFMYTNGTMTDLGTLGGNGSEAVAINNNGEIVGTSATPHGVRGDFAHAFVYGLDGNNVMSDLGYFGNDSDPGANFDSAAIGISDGGTIVATSCYIASFDYGSDGGVAFGGGIGGPLGFEVLSFAPAAISDSGKVLSSNWGGISNIIPTAINDSGQIVGSASRIAFLYSPTVGMTMLGTLGGTDSSANAINNVGQVVGQSDVAGGGQDAFLYDSNFCMMDLNNVIPANSGWMLQSANGINADGQIVGDGVIDGESHAFLLSPVLSVPEPSSFGTLAIVGFGLAQRRKRYLAI